MKASALICCLALAVASASGCYRTHYVNFSPDNPMQPAAPAASGPTFEVRNSWRHFFIWGWVPEEIFIDARADCGGAANLDSIQTRRTFLEGLVAAFAGYYINIYSPWNAAVLCKQDPRAFTAPPAAQPANVAPAP